MRIACLTSLNSNPRKQLAAAALAAFLPLAAQAGTFSDMVIFGDSLSDTGNLLAMTGPNSPLPTLFPQFFPVPLPPSPPIGPYYAGRFSNGAIWVDGLSTRLELAGKANASGFSLGPAFGDFFVPAPDAGNNYAVAAARTSTTGFFEPLPVPTGIQTQVAQFVGRSPDSEVLYIVMAGGNNIRDAALLPKEMRLLTATLAAQDYGVAIDDLVGKGARTILVSNVNDIGKTPEASLIRGNAVAATEASDAFNATLTQVLDGLEGKFADQGIPIRFIRLDLYGLFNAVYADAARGGPVFGLSNATMPCFNAAQLQHGFFPNWKDDSWQGSDCTTSLFSDALHPTAALHSILARTAAACRLPDGKFLGGMPPEGSPIQGLGRFCSIKQPAP